MKKIFLIFLLFSFYFLVFPLEAEAKINWPWQQEQQTRQEVREQVQEEVQEQLGLTGTPSPGTPKEIRQQIREQVQEKVQELKDKLSWLLPFGFNRMEIISIPGVTPPTDLGVSKDGKNFTVKVTEKTLLLRKFGGKSSLSEFSVGDIISVRGKWLDEEKTILESRVIRNVSIQKRKGTFWGTVKSIDSGAKSFVLTSVQRGDQSVSTDEKTRIVNRREEPISFEDLLLGHRVRVSGLWDSKLGKITEVSRIKDWSLPPGPTPTVGSTN